MVELKKEIDESSRIVHPAQNKDDDRVEIGQIMNESRYNGNNGRNQDRKGGDEDRR